jgi:hypothetical protein
MNKKMRIGLVVLVSILFFSSVTSADWVQDNGSLNYDPTELADWTSSLSTDSATPYVSWAETSPILTDVRVKRWNGAAWVQLGGSLDNDVNRKRRDPRPDDLQRHTVCGSGRNW